MRFIDYMRLSSTNDDIAEFRSLNLRLVKERTVYNDIIERLDDKYNYVIESIDVKNRLNKELNKFYNGGYNYDFCIDEGMSISELKIKDSYKQRMMIKYHLFNDELAKIKNKFEDELK
jgi:hypothetical protein